MLLHRRRECTTRSVTGTLDAPLLSHIWRLSAKSKGFLPGKPRDAGFYADFGVTAA